MDIFIIFYRGTGVVESLLYRVGQPFQIAPTVITRNGTWLSFRNKIHRTLLSFHDHFFIKLIWLKSTVIKYFPFNSMTFPFNSMTPVPFAVSCKLLERWTSCTANINKTIKKAQLSLASAPNEENKIAHRADIALTTNNGNRSCSILNSPNSKRTIK